MTKIGKNKKYQKNIKFFIETLSIFLINQKFHSKSTKKFKKMGFPHKNTYKKDIEISHHKKYIFIIYIFTEEANQCQRR